jgi:hypothetical protein
MAPPPRSASQPVSPGDTSGGLGLRRVGFSCAAFLARWSEHLGAETTERGVWGSKAGTGRGYGVGGRGGWRSLGGRAPPPAGFADALPTALAASCQGTAASAAGRSPRARPCRRQRMVMPLSNPRQRRPRCWDRRTWLHMLEPG